MSWSRAEILALATKAARGAGAPAGQAALFGEAVALHLGQGRGADAVSAALDALPEGPISTLPLVMQTVVPMAQEGGEAKVEWPGDTDLARSYFDALPLECTVQREGATGLTLTFATRERPLSLHRITDCDDLIAKMTELAARTFVPESAASRLSGAGAGLSDND